MDEVKIKAPIDELLLIQKWRWHYNLFSLCWRTLSACPLSFGTRPGCKLFSGIGSERVC